jgi:hypothetical protein
VKLKPVKCKSRSIIITITTIITSFRDRSGDITIITTTIITITKKNRPLRAEASAKGASSL